MFDRLIADPARLPKAGDAERAAVGLERWRESGAASDDTETRRFAETVANDAVGRGWLDGVFGNSPYLSQSLLHEMTFVRGLLNDGPDRAAADLLAGLDADPSAGTEADAMRALRIAKRRLALLVALADIGGVWSLEKVTGALSVFAQAALRFTCRRLLAAVPDGDPVRSSKLIVLGMGKLGARELNYSSDIDLIVLYDGDAVAPDERPGLQRQFVRLTHNLVRYMAERTADGYVFRTDLRLRPDPGSTPPALTIAAAEMYYESLGQNWERAAFIKARAVAGDLDAGARFLSQLTPFIWRRHLDFAAIQDIHSIKRQINAYHGGGDIAVAGHNVKLGRGGIREIELFAQTQQLIWGGREPRLRTAGTCDTLRALAELGRVDAAEAGRLIDAYGFLREAEHRLQMVADEQTQTLPEDAKGLERFARFMGFDDAEGFSAALLGKLRAVEEIYAELFEEAPALSGPGNLVFTGTDHDPETLKTIAAYGFEDAATVSSLIRGWHHGRYRAMRSTRARELLTELTPALLDALAKTSNPTAAFVKFDEFLSRLPAGVQLFSLFYSNLDLLGLVAEIMGEAPRLADHLSRRPSSLEAVLQKDFFNPPPPPPVLREDLARVLAQARDYQDHLDLIRRWTNDRKFQVGVQMLRNKIDTARAGEALTDIADTALSALLPAVESDFARRHGRTQGNGMAIVALGKAGGREMTMKSDLDLLFIYDGSDEGMSDGARPLAPSHYFARLSQSFLNAVTALTEEGSLYEVDMRLRPSGQSGPIASSLASLEKYHREASWTWEHMALTRARVICGPGELPVRIERAIRDVLVRPRDGAKLAADVADMRARIERERRDQGAWDIKYLRGGLIDIEFIVQFLLLRHAAEHPEVLAANTSRAMGNLKAAGVLRGEAAEALSDALILWRQLHGLLRLTVDGRLDERRAPPGLKSLLAAAGGARDFEDLKAHMRRAAERTRNCFREIIEEPAARAASGDSKGEG
ncbi:MAG: bifunctional [glutamine synthetase] adenylyltransferase/[glutamine synthetase]-adenylyl-L-tyrosine phosphorylase [Alphaproteobacteria bacterium]